MRGRQQNCQVGPTTAARCRHTAITWPRRILQRLAYLPVSFERARVRDFRATAVIYAGRWCPAVSKAWVADDAGHAIALTRRFLRAPVARDTGLIAHPVSQRARARPMTILSALTKSAFR